MGVAIDPLALVDNLKTSEKQLLEIDAGPVLRRMKRLSERKKYGCAL